MMAPDRTMAFVGVVRAIEQNLQANPQGQICYCQVEAGTIPIETGLHADKQKCSQPGQDELQCGAIVQICAHRYLNCLHADSAADSARDAMCCKWARIPVPSRNARSSATPPVCRASGSAAHPSIRAYTGTAT